MTTFRLRQQWFLVPRPSPKPQLRLLCFADIGCDGQRFYGWLRHLPRSMEIWIPVLPGRAQRGNEVPLRRMRSVLDGLERAVVASLEGPFAIFGHGLGGLIGFELARVLQERWGMSPEHLFVASVPAPHKVGDRPRMALLPDDQLISLLGRFGGLDPTLREDPEELSARMPILRADLELSETYSPSRTLRKLKTPITAFGGIDDPFVPIEQLAQWGGYTSERFEQRVLSGGHSLRDSELLLLTLLMRNLVRAG